MVSDHHSNTNSRVSFCRRNEIKGGGILDFEAKSQEKNNRYKSSGSSSFNTTQSTEGCFNLNREAGHDEGDEVQEVQQPMGRDRAKKKGAASSASSTSGNEEALEDEMLYMQPTDYLTGIYLVRALEMKRAIKER
ncbi:hypothetical protein Tco_0487083 [Tanacetum coccineum]